MINFLHNLYNKTFLLKNKLLNVIKLPQILRLVILQFSNGIIPLFYSFSLKSEYSLTNKDKIKTEFVVSLTSFPNRISKVHLVIESIFRQTYVPSRVVLWLSDEQFNSINDLPRRLLKLRERGLEIYLKPGDLRSYKKYYYLLKENFEQGFIIIDDDIFYPSYLIENLVKTHRKHTNAICANRCAIIETQKPYTDWTNIFGEESEKRFDLLPTGCGGVLYPKNSLDVDVLNMELFTELCYDADDIWLNCMAFLKKTPIVYTGGNEYFLAVKSLNNRHLHTKNIGESKNDLRIKLVRDYYRNKLGTDVFLR